MSKISQFGAHLSVTAGRVVVESFSSAKMNFYEDSLKIRNTVFIEMYESFSMHLPASC